MPVPSITAVCACLWPWNWVGESAENPLHVLLKACRLGDLPAVQKLLAAAPLALVNLPLDGDLALHLAVSSGHMPIAKFLIEQGAKPELKDGQRLTAYDYAMMSIRRDQLMPELLAYVIGHKVDAASTVLHNPGHLELVCEYIKGMAGKGVAVTDEQMEDIQYPVFATSKALLAPALDSACQVSPHVVFGYGFNKKYISLDEQIDAAGNTLLHFAATQGNEKLLVIALAHGIDLNLVVNKDGQNPLHFACAMASPCIQLLINQAKIDISKSDAYGISPLALIGACAHKHDPLNLSRTQALMATLIAAEWAVHYALSAEKGNYAIWGLASLAQLASYGPMLAGLVHLCAHRPVLAKGLIAGCAGLWMASLTALKRISGIAVDVADPAWGDFKAMLLNAHACLAAAAVAISVFGGIKKAWKNRNLNPLKAFRNAVVYGINMAHLSAKIFKTIGLGYRHFNSLGVSQEMHSEEAKLAACEKQQSGKWFWQRDPDACQQHKDKINAAKRKIDHMLATLHPSASPY